MSPHDSTGPKSPLAEYLELPESTIPFEQEVLSEPPVGSGAPPARLVETTAKFTARPQARGKFLFVGEEKFWVRGVTYGTFSPDEDGHNYPPSDIVETDFAAMAARGINTVRLYTVPPRWLLDSAEAQGLRVMVGLPWEQHVTFLDSKKRTNDIEARVRAGECARAREFHESSSGRARPYRNRGRSASRGP